MLETDLAMTGYSGITKALQITQDELVNIFTKLTKIYKILIQKRKNAKKVKFILLVSKNKR